MELNLSQVTKVIGLLERAVKAYESDVETRRVELRLKTAGNYYAR